MDYPLENLGPERFQQLCQALLVASEPNISCYPIGMPDGGRDAIKHLFDDEGKSFYIYQIKFSRNLKLGKESRDWVIKTLADEVEKATRLRARGAKRYILITNVQGTSHLDSGSMDQANKELEDLLGMPVECWWRDDLCRRLDGNWSIKLRYPEIITGQDYLRLVLEQNKDSDKTRRADAIKLFLKDQYREDQEVKFKQVELQNKLLDLFVDLPFEVTIANNKHFEKNSSSFAIDSDITLSERNKSWVLTDESPGKNIGTATLLLNEKAGNLLQQVVVEGAPGQGKSTLAQYLCQIHRIRLLEKEDDLAALPENHRNSPIYIPFKVDLRDLSEWFAGVDPFSQNRDLLERTTETFLARMVEHKTGGLPFNVFDLIEISKLSPLFIAFDGLDEVADIKRRADVVSGITKSLVRLRENCPRIKVIVTSRPAAFANSPGFEQATFAYLQLGSVTKNQINAYAAKWLAARSLLAKERGEFEKILEEKLDQPHLRDLSKNPMQLTILLSLILTKGSALPDKRTALYDAYIELFFGRESSKNPIVRDNLELLKDIHRYLAWELHSRAETGRGKGTDGRFSTEEMKVILQTYLKKEGRKVEIIEQIFSVMLERIVMIVSRIEGTHEFEVQPLREYFAARYLYDTAPYSPAGNEKSGTKPDRFDAIARNPFWLNVVRFFCGCFTKGELLDLADRVKDLIEDEEIGETRRPTLLAATLLQDWVFSQTPRAVEEISNVLATKKSIRKLIPSDLGYRREEALRIPLACGGNDIFKKSFELTLDRNVNRDLIESLSRFILANIPSGEIDSSWIILRPKSERDFERWLRSGFYLLCLKRMDKQKIKSIIGDKVLSMAEFELFWRAGKSVCVAETGVQNATMCINYIVSSPNYWPHEDDISPYYLVPFISTISRHNRLNEEFNPDMQVSIVEEYKKLSSSIKDFDVNIPPYLIEFSRICYEISRIIIDEIGEESEKISSISTWEFIADSFQKVFGDVPLVIALGMTVCTFNARRGRAKKADLLDSNQSLMTRLRYAKSQSKNLDWWPEIIALAHNNQDKEIILRILWSWSPTANIIKFADEIADVMDSIPLPNWQKVVDTKVDIFHRGSNDSKPVNTLPFSNKSLRYAYLLAQRENQKFGTQIFLKYFFKGANIQIHPGIEYFQIHTSTKLVENGSITWDEYLNLMKTISVNTFGGFILSKEMPSEVINEILKNPDLYPRSLWENAQREISRKISRVNKPVAVTAKKDKWFID